MKGRFSLNRILHNNRLMIVISLVLAIILWAGVVYGSGSNEKRNINLGTYTLSFADNSYAKETGLSIIQGAEVDVQVEVSGPRFRINQAQSEISISADLSSIVRPGTYRIPLTATGASDYTIDAVNPSSVTVVADYILSKTLLLTTDISAVTVPEGGEYRLGSAMLDTSVINDDSTLEIEGPQTVLERIESVVARISEGKTIEKATVFPAELVALDANGNAVDTTLCNFLDKNGNVIQSLNLTVPVSVSREVPLTYTVENLPAAYRDDTSFITLEPSSVTLWGPEESLENYQVDLGTLDFDNIGPGNTTIQMPLHLKSGVQVDGNISEVAVSIRMQNLEIRYVDLPLTGSNVRIVNSASGQLLSVDESTILSIPLVGPADSLEALTENNLQVLVDLKGETVADGDSAQARVTVTGFDDVWVYYGTGSRDGFPVTLRISS